MRPSSSSAPSDVSSARASASAARGGGSRNFRLAGIGDAPGGEVERQAREVGGKDFRRRVGQEAAVRRLLPQAIADARLDASGAPAPLVGVGARDAHGLQPRQPDVGLEARHAHQPAVDDDADALDGQRSLGDRGRQHDLAPARRRRARPPGPARARPSRRRAARRRRSGFSTRSASAAATRAISPWPGRKTRIEPRSSASARKRRAHDLVLDARARIAAEIARLDRKARPALSISAASPISFATRAPSSVADITRRRKSSRKPPCASSASARPRSASSERSWNSSNSTARDAFERGVVEDHAREHAFGDDLDARARGNEALQAHAQADGLADLLAKARRHARRGGARGEAARLQHDDLAGPREGLVQQRERYARRLAGAGRRDEDRAGAAAERRDEPRQGFVDRQAVGKGAHRRLIAAGRRSRKWRGGQRRSPFSPRSGEKGTLTRRSSAPRKSRRSRPGSRTQIGKRSRSSTQRAVDLLESLFSDRDDLSRTSAAARRREAPSLTGRHSRNFCFQEVDGGIRRIALRSARGGPRPPPLPHPAANPSTARASPPIAGKRP